MKTKLPTSHSQLTQRFYDPTNEVAFKRVFDDAERLKDFLNALLEEYLGSKIVSFDRLPLHALSPRQALSTCMLCLKLQDELKKSHVIIVCISKSKSSGKNVPCISFHEQTEDKICGSELGPLRYLCIELSQFDQSCAQNAQYEWLFFLKNAADLQSIPETHSPLVRAAYNEIETCNWSPEQYDAYVRADMVVARDEDRVEEEVAEGFVEGFVKGFTEEMTSRGFAVDALGVKRLAARALMSKGSSKRVVAKAVQLNEEALDRLLEHVDV